MNAAARCAIACAIAFLVPLAAADGLVKPTRRVAIIDTAHLRAFVPHDQAEALKPLVARADVIYQALARDAGYTISRRLYLLISDDFDDHNGFSTVVPYALVQVELAPPPPQSGIFDGHDHVERTLVHEFTHHISNDRNPVGFRRVL
nr:hypothetical protein [Planctomycetota bacterium]